MGFAFGLLVSKKFKLIDDSRNEALFSKGISWLLALLAVCGLLVSPCSISLHIRALYYANIEQLKKCY
jgi:hypothetical protein